MIHHHRILFHNVIMETEERMEEERAKGYLFPGSGKIKIIDVTEEQRIFTQPLQCVIVAIIKYEFTDTGKEADINDLPLFPTADGDML